MKKFFRIIVIMIMTVLLFSLPLTSLAAESEMSTVSDIRKSGPPVFFFVFLFAVLIYAIYIIILIVIMSGTTTRQIELPNIISNSNAMTKPIPVMSNCPKCGTAFGDSNFCAQCGTSKQVKNTYVFPIVGKIYAQQFETLLNEWLAANPYICDCKIKLDTKQSLFMPFANKKFTVRNAVIEYSVAETPVNYQYGLAFIYKMRLFGPIGYSSEKHVSTWADYNPDCKVVSTHGGRIQHWNSNGGIWAEYYNYVFFKKPKTAFNTWASVNNMPEIHQ